VQLGLCDSALWCFSCYRAATTEYGMWDQVRVDHGTEFYLSLYEQEINAHLRTNVDRQPYIQTQSKRVWKAGNLVIAMHQ